MKHITRTIAVVVFLSIPVLLLAQALKQDAPQRQAVTFQVKDGDSIVPKTVDVVYNPAGGQDKPQLPYDQAPEGKTQVQPKYPDLATKAGLEGTVWTKVFIDETGKVTKVTITKSDAEIFNQPSIDAAMQWVFKPALKDGKPITAEVAIPFRFGLQKGPFIPDFTVPGRSSLSVAVTARPGYAVVLQHPFLIGQSSAGTNQWYPESALKDQFKGTVILKLTINIGGRVERVEITSHAREDLDSAAVQLARTWTFIPGQYTGMPEKSIISVPVTFYPGRPQK